MILDYSTLAFLAAPFAASLILTGMHAYLGVHVSKRRPLASMGILHGWAALVCQ